MQPFFDVLIVRNGGLGEGSFFIYVETTDAGPDEAARRRRIQASVANVSSIWYWDCNCFLHQYHLAVRDGLEFTEAFLDELANTCPDISRGFKRYFGSIAKLNHFWRERVSDFIGLFEKIHGDHGHNVQYRRYPLTCVCGRWGSVEYSEKFLLERGRKYLEPVLLALLSKHMKADKKAADDAKEKATAKAKGKSKSKVQKKTGSLARG